MDLDEAIQEVSRATGLIFKDKQYEVIKSFCSWNDSFVSLPTGYGKSMIYAVLPLVLDKLIGKNMVSTFEIPTYT